MVAKEREIQLAQAANEGKPPEIVAKMVEGRLHKYLAEISPDRAAVREGSGQATVGKLLQTGRATVTGFLRFEVGEGIEKKQENFAAEVMAQVEAAKDEESARQAELNLDSTRGGERNGGYRRPGSR